MEQLNSDRFVIEDEGDGWLTLARTGGDSMSLRDREIPELIELLQRAAAKSPGATEPLP
jgi:hypothetical protein